MSEGFALGFEIRVLFFDDEASGLKVGFELLAVEPVELLGGFVSGCHFSRGAVDFVAMLAMENLFFAIELMHRVNRSERAILE